MHVDDIQYLLRKKRQRTKQHRDTVHVCNILDNLLTHVSDWFAFEKKHHAPCE